MLENLSRWDFAILLKNGSNGLIDFRQLQGHEALWVEPIFNGGLQLGIGMHDEVQLTGVEDR